MTIFVYTTDKVMSDAKRYSCVDSLEALKKRVEDSQSISFLDTFPPPFLVKKKFGSSGGRLVGRMTTVEVDKIEHSVLVFTDIFQRSDRSYDLFISNPAKVCGEIGNILQEDIQKSVADRLKKDPPKPKDKPSESEFGYLNAPAVYNSLSNEELVCETQVWVEKSTLETYKKTSRILDTLREELSDTKKQCGAYSFAVKNTNLTVHANYYPQHRIWLLKDITVLGDVAEEPTITTDDGNDEKIAVFKNTFRAYPLYMLADEDTWEKIEKDPLGNYSLSEEETNILNSVANNQNNQFPLFINGRAGSGKSTILQYIFSDYLFRYLTYPELPHPPVYFASNPKLLIQAKTLVKSILRNNTDFSTQGKFDGALKFIHDDEKLNELFEKSFKEFKLFLLSKIPLSERNSKFANEKYINYSKFKEWWTSSVGNQQNANKNYGPDLSWHVIRSYIKGTSMEGFLDREDYASLDINQCSVSIEAFQTIYDKVWNNNYSTLRDKGYWDDQDLVRYVLDNNLLKSELPGIFCDEAQDFTKIELEAFLRMSLFSERSIMPHEMPQIPFVFAGDEFQTLNPTGFKWNAVKAMFTEKFIMAVNPLAGQNSSSNSHSSTKQSINYRILLNNYRSSSPIVRFCNFIQLLRIARFNLTNVQPQREWSDSKILAPVCSFYSEDNVFWEGIKKRAGETVFIVPANEENILSYIENDPVLKKNIPFDNEKKVPLIPVLSPVMAKGLEYPCVVVYGFGSDCDDNIFAWPSKEKTEAYSLRLSLEYFLNKLYVAVSRARKQLYIVDSKENMKKLWRFATSEDHELDNEIKKRCSNYQNWQEHIYHLQKGSVSYLKSDSRYNPSDSARQLEASGISSKDSIQLRYAANLYRDANENTNATICEALADEFDCNYQKAAINYKNVNRFEDAIRCLWLMKEKGWNELVQICMDNTEFIGRTEFLFARALTDKKIEPVISAFGALCNSLKEDKTSELLVNNEVLEYCLAKLLKIFMDDTNRVKNSAKVFKYLSFISESGLKINKNNLADIAFGANEYEEAIKIWEDLNEENSINYYQAKAKTSEYPDSLSWLYLAKDWKSIIAAHNSNIDFDALTDNQYITLIRAYLMDKKDKVAWKFLPKLQQRKFYELLLTNCKDYGIPASWNITLDEAVNLAILKEYGIKEVWENVFAKDGNVPHLRPRITAKAIARLSDLNTVIPNTGNSDQASMKGISDFLAYYFLGEDKRSKKYEPEIGAAFEQTKNYSFSQQYYQLAGNSDTAATERMVFCMEKHAKIYAKQGNIESEEKILKEASLLRRSIGSDDSYVIPEVPHIDMRWEPVFEALFDRQESISWANTRKKMEQDLETKLKIEEQKKELEKKEKEKDEQDRLKSITEEHIKRSKEKYKNNPQFSDKGYCFRYKEKAHRLNIERDEDGMSCSIICGQKISGEFVFEDYPDNQDYKRISDTDILVRLAKEENGVFAVKFIGSDKEYTYTKQE